MLLARILLLLVAAGAVAAAVVLGGRAGSSPGAVAAYACPMHPEVVAARPSPCPICGRALEPTAGARARGTSMESPGSMPGMAGMADLTAVENVRKHKILDVVRMQSLLLNVRELRGAAFVEDTAGTIVALFYRDQIDSLAADEPGVFSSTESPQLTATVRRIPGPAQAWDLSTARIRFRLDAPRAGEVGAGMTRLPVGQVGWVRLAYKARDVLTVPAAAVLQSPEGPYVLVSKGGSRFEKRPIEIGETFLKQGFAVVLSGLRVQERVVSRATFFLDADRRLAAQGER